ncbi:MAG: hypothetical protein KAS75_08540 [Planctomycetes bacterium]|nr:hypothetical protein [Planctomycetota bacterium]
MKGFKLRSPVLFAIIALLVLPFFIGCNAPKNHLATFNGHFEIADYNNSALFAQKRIKNRKTPKGEDLLWTLQLGSVERIRQDYNTSTEYFDKSEDMLKYYDEQSRLGDTVGSAIVNDNIIPYRGEEYDGIMINVYKALNFMAEDKMPLARVEFNRALDRQRRAKEKFNTEINKLKTELEEKNQKSEFTKSNVENPKINSLLTEKYPNLYNFQVYPDFVNPFATYMAAVYFNLAGDYARAADLFKESYGMVGDNSYIAEDLSATERILDKNGKLQNTVWLIFENGLGPVKTEFRLDIPLFIATNQVKYVGLALPKLEYRSSAYPYLIAQANGKSYQTRVLSDMDRVIQTEFSKDFKGILTRAIISATTKAVAQYALHEEGSNSSQLMSLAVAMYSYASTAADVRIWTALPKNFQIARFQKPKDGKFRITRPGAQPFDIDIPSCNNAIVYVKIPTVQAKPIYEIMTF